MGAEIVGLLSTEQFAATRSENARRSILWAFPQGKFPLAGLLSLTEEGETLADVVLGWWEERYRTSKSQTTQVSAGQGPFATFVNTGGSVTYTPISVDFTPVISNTICVFVQDGSLFRVRDIVQMQGAKQTGGATSWYTFVVTQVDMTNNVLYGYWIDLGLSTTTIDTSSNNNGIWAVMIGTSTAEGDRSLDGGTTFPTLIQNLTQIFRTPYRITGSALQMGQRYDQTGPYRKMCKMNALRHMEAMESTLMFGVQRSETAVTVDGESTTRRFMGGILWYLKQWELQNINNGGQFDYVKGAASVLNLTPFASDKKRIITVQGALQKSQFNELIRRAFFRTSNNGFQKLFLMGAGLLQVMQDFFENNSIRIHKLDPKNEAYGMSIYRWETVHGELLMKGHPLFIENPGLQYSGFFIDLGNLKYHPLAGRDTTLLKHRQPNDADYRKDEWLGESSVEVNIPESHMFIDTLTQIIS